MKGAIETQMILQEEMTKKKANNLEKQKVESIIVDNLKGEEISYLLSFLVQSKL